MRPMKIRLHFGSAWRIIKDHEYCSDYEFPLCWIGFHKCTYGGDDYISYSYGIGLLGFAVSLVFVRESGTPENSR